LLFTASDFTYITSHIHNWVLFFALALSLHLVYIAEFGVSFPYSGSLWSSLYCRISSLCVGLYRWFVKVSWLGKLVFWWEELDFFSLEPPPYFGLRSNNRKGTQPCPSMENWIKDLLSMAPPIRTRPSFPLSQSLPSESFHKPLIPLH